MEKEKEQEKEKTEKEAEKETEKATEKSSGDKPAIDPSKLNYVELLSGEPFNYVKEIEQVAGNLVRRGEGYIALISLYCIHGYSALKKNSNKKIFIRILQEAAEGTLKMGLLSYCVLDDGAFFLVKTARADDAKVYTNFVIKEFSAQFNKGFRRIDNPFRQPEYKQIFAGTLAHEVQYVHSLSPNGDYDRYPYNSYHYLLEGVHDANLILNLELGMNSGKGNIREQLKQILDGSGRANAPSRGVEHLDKVLGSVKEEQLAFQETYPERKIDYVMTESAARSNTPYETVAKRMGLDKRHDLMVSSLVDFIMRRETPYVDAVRALKIRDTDDLRAEVLLEINRIYSYSYDYIVRKILLGKDENDNYVCGDSDYDILVHAFRSIHERTGVSFERLCVNFHIQKDILKIRKKCNF